MQNQIIVWLCHAKTDGRVRKHGYAGSMQHPGFLSHSLLDQTESTITDRIMAETKLIRDDAYEEMASTYQCLQIDALNNTLKENGIDDAGLRREICEQFTFAMGNFHDQYWFESEGHRVHPLLCFTSRFLDVDTDVNQLGEVYAPSDCFAFHEYSFGNNEWYFDEHNEDANGIKNGIIGDEDQP